MPCLSTHIPKHISQHSCLVISLLKLLPYLPEAYEFSDLHFRLIFQSRLTYVTEQYQQPVIGFSTLTPVASFTKVTRD